MVPTGYSLSGTLFLKIRTASFSFSGSAFLMYVFLILCPSRIQVKDFSETVTSCAYTLHTIERNKVNAFPVKRVVIVFIATPFNGAPWRYEKAGGYQRPACPPASPRRTRAVSSTAFLHYDKQA